MSASRPISLADLQRIQRAHAAVDRFAADLSIARLMHVQTGVGANDRAEAAQRLEAARAAWQALMDELIEKFGS